MIRGAILLAWAAASAGAQEQVASLLAGWETADPARRLEIQRAWGEEVRTTLALDALPVLVECGGRRRSLAELWAGELASAIGAGGGQEEGPAALPALAALRAAYSAPHPVTMATLDLFLEYAARILEADGIGEQLRIRLLVETLSCVRSLEGRVQPGQRTRWLLAERLLPPLLAILRRGVRDEALRDSWGELAAAIDLPWLLSEEQQARVAALTKIAPGRNALRRAWRRGGLDGEPLLAFARSVVAQANDDPAFAAGSVSLLLELLCEERLPPRDRSALIDAVLHRMPRSGPAAPLTADLLAAAFGGEPSATDSYDERFSRFPEGVPIPTEPGAIRFLHVQILRENRGAAPVLLRVVRADTPLYRPIRCEDGAGERLFLGVLVPSREGPHADLLGPPPQVPGTPDALLLRRPLELERVCVRIFEREATLCEVSVALPQDASEPVPLRGATLGDLLRLAEQRFRRGVGDEERLDLVRLLLLVDTPEARRLALAQATTPSALALLLPLAEAGEREAVWAVLARLGDLAPEERERALTAAAARHDPESRQALARLCSAGDLLVAGSAADLLLTQGDASGVLALLRSERLFRRACGTALALRASPLAGALRIPLEPGAVEELGSVAGAAFGAADRPIWQAYAAWITTAFLRPEEAKSARRAHPPFRLGQSDVTPAEFVRVIAPQVREGRIANKQVYEYVRGILSPVDPGAGLSPEALDRFLDALEERVRKNPQLERAWVDALLVLACAQHGIESGGEFLDVANRRLERYAGAKGPRGARARPGLLWPAWADREAAR